MEWFGLRKDQWCLVRFRHKNNKLNAYGWDVNSGHLDESDDFTMQDHYSCAHVSLASGYNGKGL